MVCLVFLTTSAAQALEWTPKQQRVLQEHAEVQRTFAESITPISEDCVRQGLPDVADRIRQLALPFAEQTLDVDVLPEEVQPDLSPTLPQAQLRWQAPLRKLQQAYASDLYLLSRRSIEAGLPSAAFQMIREAAFHDPDHVEARKILGYVRYEDRWTTPYTALMLKREQVWHPQFGWLPKAAVDRYEQGERFYRGRWMSAAKESALRTAIANGWVIETDHFIVKSNYSQERAVELTVALEDLHRFFMREFSGLFNTRQQMYAMFNLGAASPTNRANKYEIWYFRNVDEFNRFLANKQPALQGVNGIYLTDDRKAHFYANPDDPQRNIETMYHEVTHQLLSESSRNKFPIAEERDFWIVEGFACYMESFRDEDGHLTVGDPRHSRTYWARQRVVTEDWYIPIAEFTSYGRRQFQNGADLKTLQKYYSEATGLTHFLLHYEDGLYRDGCIEYLAQLYTPDKSERNNPRGLDEILGVPFQTLD
ncbi:MAG: hypothetical protein KDA75_16425, partial [Planctomycetaceae bacterium]|nr:hypothetical protein [Planctomycetaceae bacterium]